MECFTILLGFNWLFSTEGCCSWEDVVPAQSCSTPEQIRAKTWGTFFPIAWRFCIWRPSWKSQMFQMIWTVQSVLTWHDVNLFDFFQCLLMIFINGYDLNIVFWLLFFHADTSSPTPGLLGHGSRWEVVTRLWDRCEQSNGAQGAGVDLLGIHDVMLSSCHKDLGKGHPLSLLLKIYNHRLPFILP